MFRITGDGIHIYPRVEALAADMQAYVAGEAAAMGGARFLQADVKGLEEMLGGGFDRDSMTLVVGTPGSGKTLFGLSFISAGADAQQPALFMGYHDTPDTLIRKGEAVGLPIRRGANNGVIHIRWKSPTELLVDREVEQMLELVDRHGIQRVVIDAIEDLRNAVIPRSRDLAVLGALANLLRDRGITTVVLQDLSRIVGVNFDLPMAELSATMDNVLHLRYVEQKGEMKRLIAVLKVRAQAHDHRLRELIVTEKGLRVGDPFHRYDLVLTGLGLPR